MQEKLLTELTAYSFIELTAVVLALIYIVLAARNIRYCWIAAFVSSAIFVFVLWQAQLLMDAALNVYYVAMAVYGWLQWSKKPTNPSTSNANTTITQRNLSFHAVAIVSILVLSLISGTLLARNTAAAFPYLDSLTTWGSLFATWLLAKRVLENWWYWILLDSLGIYLYFQKDLHFTMILFAIYVLMSIYALFHWRRILKNEALENEALDNEALDNEALENDSFRHKASKTKEISREASH